MQPKLLTDIPVYRKDTYPAHVRIVEWFGTQKEEMSSTSFCKRIDQFMGALIALGLEPGQHVCVQSEAGSLDILAVEFAIMRIGGVVCPVHVHLSTSALSGILSLIEPVLCIVLDEEHRDVFLSRFPTRPGKSVVALTSIPLNEVPFDKLVSPDPDDVALVIFTSGTTGQPKGVMLTHRGMIANVMSALAVIPIDYRDTVLSYLPVSHVFERVVMYTYLTAGVNVHFASSFRHARLLFSKINPHYITAVPRILEQVFSNFLAAADRRDFFRNQLVHWALQQSSSGSRFSRMVARWVVLRRLRPVFGRRLKGILVGGAAMNIEIIHLFETAGVAVREGYGLSESGGVVAVNRFSPGEYLHGTVGIPLPGVEVKIEMAAGDESGEILVRSAGNMIGYFNNVDQTQSAFSDGGWLRTGDIGLFIQNRYLKITSRAKDIFKNSFGEYVIPGNIETKILGSYLVDQAIAVGFQKPFTAVLLRPDFDQLKDWCEDNGVHWTAPMYMVHNPEVISAFQEIIDSVNPLMAKHERIQGFRLVHDDWTIENGMLTPSLKLRRVPIEEAYRKMIDEIYK